MNGMQSMKREYFPGVLFLLMILTVPFVEVFMPYPTPKAPRDLALEEQLEKIGGRFTFYDGIAQDHDLIYISRRLQKTTRSHFIGMAAVRILSRIENWDIVIKDDEGYKLPKNDGRYPYCVVFYPTRPIWG
jgi:hypothetical protein